jgi:hypothetical protein
LNSRTKAIIRLLFKTLKVRAAVQVRLGRKSRWNREKQVL